MSSCFEIQVAAAQKLLNPDEQGLPNSVSTIIEQLCQRGMWFTMSRNPPVRSCREAASRRSRLGSIGIDLADEMRSYVAEAKCPDGPNRFILFHCRGDRSFDFDKINNLPNFRGLDIQKADLNVAEFESIGYGLINPFSTPNILGKDKTPIEQYFDNDLTEFVGSTESMMTNAGEQTWAIEFNPADLKTSLPPFGQFHSLSKQVSKRDRKPSTIGILTGNSPESGSLLWKKVNLNIRRELESDYKGDISNARVIVHSLPAMGWSMEMEKRSEKLREHILTEVDQMAKAGASTIAFACNTTQYYENEIDEFLSKSESNFVSMVPIIKRWMNKNNDKRIFIAGIGYVTSRDGWSAFEGLFDNSNVILPNSTQTEQINQLAYQVKQNRMDHKNYQKFRSIVRTIDADIVLLLLTELSQIFDSFPRNPLMGKRIVDAMDLYAESICTAAMS